MDDKRITKFNAQITVTRDMFTRINSEKGDWILPRDLKLMPGERYLICYESSVDGSLLYFTGVAHKDPEGKGRNYINIENKTNSVGKCLGYLKISTDKDDNDPVMLKVLSSLDDAISYKERCLKWTTTEYAKIEE